MPDSFGSHVRTSLHAAGKIIWPTGLLVLSVGLRGRARNQSSSSDNLHAPDKTARSAVTHTSLHTPQARARGGAEAQSRTRGPVPLSRPSRLAESQRKSSSARRYAIFGGTAFPIIFA